MQKYIEIIENYGGFWLFLRDGAAFTGCMACIYALYIFLYALMEV
tara:strand:- start:2612 stop:2746 length:135 start_codon:yes stop_codon:yes gene_type:complete